MRHTRESLEETKVLQRRKKKKKRIEGIACRKEKKVSIYHRIKHKDYVGFHFL